MRKLLTLCSLFAGCAAAMATDYTDKLTVTLNGGATAPTQQTISVNEQDNGKYTLTLKNFEMDAGDGDVMSVGTINVPDVDATETGSSKILATSQSITIAPGDADHVPASGYWMGPMLGSVPVDIKAEMKDDHLYALITIQFGSMSIEVVFGDVYQIGNSGFEFFHTVAVTDLFSSTEVTSDEPNCWHSFMSCTGDLAAFVSGTPHTFISDEVRPGSTGAKSVLIKSGLVLGSVVANGTLTTGRLKAGAIDATDTNNNSFLDITSTDTDANGDPFYTLLQGKPDSLSVWVKFKQGTPDAEHPYATITAVITDGSYYQEPVDKDYTDIKVADARNNKIESNDGAWQHLTLPFDYASYSEKEAKAILVTISTNADGGAGSGTDELYVDDLELVYNYSATGISIKGTPVDGFDKDKTEYEVTVSGDGNGIQPEDFEVTTDGKGAMVSVVKNATNAADGSSVFTITVTSNDLKHSTAYTVTTKAGGTVGISDAKNAGNGKVEGIYNMNGQRVGKTARGNVYITKYADGKTVKTVKK